MKLLYKRQEHYEFSYRAKSLDYPMHVENAVEIFLCTAGESMVHCGEMQYRIGAGDVFFCFPNQPHGYSNSSGVEGYMLIIPVKPYLEQYYSTLMYRLPKCPVVRDSGWQQSSLGVLLQMALSEKKTVSRNVMKGYIISSVGKILSLFELTDSLSVTDDAVRNILFYLNDHYREPLSRKQVALAVGYNESYISHIFSKALKTTLPQYVNSLRIYDAARMLTETEKTAADIALEVGFGSIRTFNRVFMEETGMTPRGFRLNNRK